MTGGEARSPRQQHAEQEPLPLEVEGRPVPFRLTARARRAVAPDSLPDLDVVTDTDGDDAVHAEADPRDTRPARARALRRAGTALPAIARELRVDELLVRAWVDEIAPVHTARGRLHTVSDNVPGPVVAAGADTLTLERQQVRQEFATVREEAARAVADRLGQDASFASALGLVAGMAEISPHAITLTEGDPEVLAPAVRWLRDALELEAHRLRIVVRVAPQAPADVVAHRWAERLGVPVGGITTTRWSSAPAVDASETMIRIADPRAAGRLAGWRDALLATVAPAD